MAFKKRFLIVVLVVGASLGMVGMLAALHSGQTVGAAPAITTTPEPPFWAKVSIAPDRDTLRVGETLTLTVDIEVSPGCGYPIYELTVRQDRDETPIFVHVDPPGDVIGPPVEIPSVWTFRATQPGMATFDAQTYGESNCGMGWHWTYQYGETGTIHVLPDEPFANWLPFVTRPTLSEE